MVNFVGIACGPVISHSLGQLDVMEVDMTSHP